MEKRFTTVGLDLAKSVFQVHAIDGEGEVVVRRKLSRSRVLAFFGSLEPCLIGMETCATAHHWAREISAFGHEVKLMPPQYVKPYVKSQKNDMADAEAICEAVTRPTMRFVPIKTPEQQALLALHGVRDHWVRLSTRLINTLRGYLAEFGIVAQRGRLGVEAILQGLEDDTDERIPDLARNCLMSLARELRHVKQEIVTADRKIREAHRASDVCQRLETIPGVGPVSPPALSPKSIRQASSRVGPSPPGLGWCPSNIQVAARIGLAGSPRRAIRSSDASWSPAPCR